ncbi:RIP metalloprotease RseP [Spirochaeta lutea]|uniref:Zinc metalloprotease n=1 Tax=Spirochaeta lutea TaxID=1480694 RepID=A0A098R2E5_9SPIO|nr:RIP metalloprotease RseP [Spirochaeta lutea]KGE73798.1 hypothetical protein DC28_00825 [Spirochaeta lutea]
MIFQIVIGLIGLGLLVSIHEFGHYIAAKATGIGVEVFSIGWGKTLWRRNLKDGSEFRLSLLPIGGYLRMKGEYQFRDAIQKGLPTFPDEEGGFFSAHPLKRILVASAGPLINLLFAVLIFTLIHLFGFSYSTFSNIIVPVEQILPGQTSPAIQAGLKPGDRIISINDGSTPYYSDIQEIVATNPQEELRLTVERASGSVEEIRITPTLDPDRGIGLIGVQPYIEPVIADVEGPALGAGLRTGDTITSVNGTAIRNTAQLQEILSSHQGAFEIVFLRDSAEMTATIYPEYTEDGQPYLGVVFQAVTARKPGLPLFSAISTAIAEVWRTLSLTIESLGMLFRGLIRPENALSGPLRITSMVGEIATSSMSQGLGTGLRITFQFLAFISIALAFGNLLPIPVLDGGQILMYLFEWVRRKPLSPKQISLFQTIGAVIVIGLLGFAVFSDLLFITRG